MTEKKLTYNDLKDGVEVAKHYGLTTKQTEQQLRNITNGMKREELRKTYEDFYRKKK